MALFIPSPESDIPEGQCLECCRLAGIIRADKDHRIPQFNLDLGELLKVLQHEFGQHVKKTPVLCRRRP